MKQFILGFFCLFAATCFASPSTELNDLLLTMKTLRADYTQTTVDPKFQDKQVVQGHVILERPNQFRWEVVKPFQQLLVADGTRLWIYDADLAQVTVQPLQDNLKDTPALLLAGDPKAITDHFKVTTRGAGFGEKSFDLTPIDENSLVLGVQLTFKGTLITKMVLIDNLHQVVTLEFTQARINDTLPADIFRFVPPAGVDVIGHDTEVSHARP
jgi:outer membrane lipoprotein carrier protein